MIVPLWSCSCQKFYDHIRIFAAIVYVIDHVSCNFLCNTRITLGVVQGALKIVLKMLSWLAYVAFN